MTKLRATTHLGKGGGESVGVLRLVARSTGEEQPAQQRLVGKLVSSGMVSSGIVNSGRGKGEEGAAQQRLRRRQNECEHMHRRANLAGRQVLCA